MLTEKAEGIVVFFICFRLVFLFIGLFLFLLQDFFSLFFFAFIIWVWSCFFFGFGLLGLNLLLTFIHFILDYNWYFKWGVLFFLLLLDWFCDGDLGGWFGLFSEFNVVILW